MYCFFAIIFLSFIFFGPSRSLEFPETPRDPMIWMPDLGLAPWFMTSRPCMHWKLFFPHKAWRVQVGGLQSKILFWPRS